MHRSCEYDVTHEKETTVIKGTRLEKNIHTYLWHPIEPGLFIHSTSQYNDYLSYWDTRQSEPIVIGHYPIANYDHPCISVSPDGIHCSTTIHSQIQIYDVNTRKIKYQIKADKEHFLCTGFINDKHIMVWKNTHNNLHAVDTISLANPDSKTSVNFENIESISFDTPAKVVLCKKPKQETQLLRILT